MPISLLFEKQGNKTPTRHIRDLTTLTLPQTQTIKAISEQTISSLHVPI